MALSKEERRTIAVQVTEAMRENYAAHGEEDCGDWADCERYLANDASDSELLSEKTKWCKQM
jgi:hypothetical protein